MKKIFLLLSVTLLGNLATAQVTDYSVFNRKFSFYVANDLGRNSYYDQKTIAELMGVMAENGADPEFILATSDVHRFEGVRSVNDPLWMTNYELIYSHPELMIDWFPLLDDHEYRGNTQAIQDYSNVGRRWTMPARYYTKTFADKDMTIRVVWIDTVPLVGKCRNEKEIYPDACKQDYQQQLAWIDSILTPAKESWIIVAGHHPICAETSKDGSERLDMQVSLDPILRKHKMDMYICGHIHSFQYVRVPGSNIDYITNSSDSLSHKVKPIKGAVLCGPASGFSIVSANKKTLELRMIDKDGNVLRAVTRNK